MSEIPGNILQRCPDFLWESLAEEDETATFFQTPAWHHIVARHLGAESFPLLFEFPDGPACLPLLRERRWGRWRWFSPLGNYTAVLCPRKLAPEQTRAITSALGSLTLQLASSPFTRNPVQTGDVLSARVQVVHLIGMNPDDPARDWEPDPRRKLRMAREANVCVRIAESPGDWDAYDSVYRKSLQRWGSRATSAYPRTLFEAIRGLPRACTRLWLAEHEGRVAAGYIEFRHNRHACIWHGASDPELFRTGAVQMLYAAMFSDAARAGYPIFDLLGSGGTATLEKFKSSLGAQTLTFDGSLNRVGLMGKIASLRDRLRGGRG